MLELSYHCCHWTPHNRERWAPDNKVHCDGRGPPAADSWDLTVDLKPVPSTAVALQAGQSGEIVPSIPAFSIHHPWRTLNVFTDSLLSVKGILHIFFLYMVWALIITYLYCLKHTWNLCAIVILGETSLNRWKSLTSAFPSLNSSILSWRPTSGEAR